MKRSLDGAAAHFPQKRERMASVGSQQQDDAGSGGAAPAPSRFGFGFRSASFSKPSAAMNVTAASGSNQQENSASENASVAAIIKQEKADPTPEVASVPLAEIDTNEQVAVRGRGRPTTRERVLPRPNVRKSSSMFKPEHLGGTSTGLPAPTPRSTSRLVMKQEPSTGGVIRRASANNASSSQEIAALKQRVLAYAPTEQRDDVGLDSGQASVVMSAVDEFEALLATLFPAELIADAEAVIQSRLKAKKFDMKARCEELMTSLRQAKTALRAVLDQNKKIGTEAIAALKGVKSICVAEATQLKQLKFQVADLSSQLRRATQEIGGVREDSKLVENRVRDITNKNEQLESTVQQLMRVRTELETSNQRLQVQLQQAQKQNDELTLDLRAYQTTMSDRVQLYEEKKKDLEQFYMRKDSEEEKRKSSEIELLQARLSEVREEMAASNQEKENYRQRSFAAEEETRRERDRSAQFERDKCAIEAQLHALEGRVAQSSTELDQMKGKLDKKDQEISGLVQNMTEIQKLHAMSSSKIDTEKKELTEKIDLLQNQLREAERSEATNGALMRELRGQAENFASVKAELTMKQEALESRVKELELQLQNATRDLNVQTGICQMLESQNRELRNENTAVNAQTEAVRSEMKRLNTLHEEAKANWQSQLASVDERVEREKAALLRQIEILHEEKVSIESEVKTLRERAANVRDGDFEEMCNVKREAEVLRLRLQELSNHGSQSIAQKDRLIEEMQEKIRQGEKVRRALHNTIQELRGNVRVFARTRPFLPSDGSKDSESLTPAVTCEFDGQTVKLRRQAKGSSGSEQDIYSFTFDKVFAQSSGQDNVFEEVSEFVQSAIDGYHVCLFSYGQTGSGKTHTMQGSGNGQMRGIIPRAIEKVLAECALLGAQGWKYTMKVSFLEIYNENLRDLLASKEDSGKALSIKKDAKGGVCVPDLTLVDVAEMQQVEKLMERASRARSVACTDMNAQSSRSHSVFSLHLQGVNDSEGIMLDGQLNLVDLAGSERASRSGVSGERLKETQAINKSLSCLADVFTAIGNKSSHIPFRNSKLTYLLQSSLSGDGKTLMMVNVSPTLESAGETLCSLRFAQQVNKCELGKPKRQIKSKKDAINDSIVMGPKKEKKAKKGKDKKDDGAENGGVLTPEEQAKLFLSANRSLQMQLAERHEQAVKAMESKRELQERVASLQGAFERERNETFGITQDMTRQYKSMQEELLNRVNTLENTNAELRDQLELARVNFEEMKREKDRVIGAKNVEIQELKAKMEEMAQEFGDMLKETLDKMRERIEITSTSFDHDGGGGGVPMIRRLDEFNLGSPTKLS